jgi:hypothetical protein
MNNTDTFFEQNCRGQDLRETEIKNLVFSNFSLINLQCFPITEHQ